jgi:HrpA-like RNA helicase
LFIREFKRICKTPECSEEFIVAAPSIEEDRALGLSEPEYCPTHRLLQVRSYSRVACHHIELEMTPEGEDLVRQVETDKGIGSLQGDELLKATFDPWGKPSEGYGPGGVGRFRRPVRVFLENQAFQPIKTRQDFKIAEKTEEILEAIDNHQVTVLVGTTGSGKSTYVPWLLLTGGEPGKLSKWAKRGPICVTQPRIQATRQVPKFIANQLNGTSLGVGAQVGFSHSGADEYDRRTRLIFKTDGKLINDIVSGAIANYSIIMIDEAHERSVNIDLILGLLKDQLYLYPHLRLIIASATIDHDTFINFYGGEASVPFILSKGIQHEVKKHFWGDPDEDWWRAVNGGQLPSRQQLPRAIGELVQNICKWLDELTGESREKENGHILVFLPGAKEIDQTVSIINSLQLDNVVALPLYSQRPLEEQEEALNPQPKHRRTFGKRRIVVSTNVAETSLTVEGIKHVIETGYIKESYWSPLKQVQELQTVRHSKAGCRQRWGRAGRICPGHAYMFYTEEDFEEFPQDSSPEIARASLEQVLLTAKAAGVRTAGGSTKLDFQWMPLKREEDRIRFAQELDRAYESLVEQQAIDAEGDLTTFGLEMRGLPAELHVARLCVEAERHGMGIEAATLLPFLKLDFGLPSLLIWDRDWDAYEKHAIRKQHLDLVFGCLDDLDLFVKLWMLWDSRTEKQREAWETESGINVQSFQKTISAERRKLLDSIKDWRKAEDRPISFSRLDALRALIAHCLPNEIYVPVESKGKEEIGRVRQRFDAPDLLEWQAFWEDGGVYQEYDEDLSFDECYTASVSGRSGIYSRSKRALDEETESDRIELVPTSICFGRDDANMLVVCQRRANFNHPVRTKVIGMNMVRIDPSWLPAINGTLVERSNLYANLSRRQDPANHEAVKLRMFLPFLLPRGSEVVATIRGADTEGGIPVEIRFDVPRIAESLGSTDRTLAVRGLIPRGLLSNSQRQVDQQIKVEVIDYETDSDRRPLVLVGPRQDITRVFREFHRRFRRGSVIDVEMTKVLEDPLGRNPVFVVREMTTGLEIPMADTDFCGDTWPRAFFGRRFDVGQQFKTHVEEIEPKTQQVRLSRGRQLLKEYLHILGGRDSQIVNVEVRRVDQFGVYVGAPGNHSRETYVGFVRYALWPPELSKEAGRTYVARMRRFERQFSLEEMLELGSQDEPLPIELDLGIDFDLLLPLAYDRFAEHNKPGDLLLGGVRVDKPLDSGGVLVSLNEELKAVIWESELGLDSNGRLRKAASYAPGSEVRTRIISMNNDRKVIRCSMFRVLPPPPSLVPGSVIEVTVALVRSAYKRPDSNDPDSFEISCSLDKQYAVRMTVPSVKGIRFRPGDKLKATVVKVDRTNLIEATFLSLIEKEKHDGSSEAQ